ncbi:unnamed protein product, partial [Urochloa humidicola]
MEDSDCPPWIDPGNAFRIVVKVEKYKADAEYAMLDMAEQQHVVWVDLSTGYNLEKFVTDMKSKIIWGPSQTLAVWSVDTDCNAEWKVRKNAHFEKMIQTRLHDRLANVVVEVVSKDGYQNLLWARSKFSPDIKCDYINNNLAECWNAWIKEYKDLPLHCMVDAIREKGVIMFEKRRRISRALHGVILPAVIHQLNASSKGIGHLKVTKGLPDQAEVTEVYKDEEVRRHVVYLNEQNCTCREWQVTGKPCPHALAVITSDRQPQYEKYVDMAYSVQRFRQAYDAGWPNITDRSQWPEVNKGFKIYPPVGKKRGPGRQRKNR